MVDVTPSPINGKRTFHITASTVAAIASCLGVLVYAAGFVTGAMTLRDNVTNLQAGITVIQTRLNAMNTTIVVDREMLSTRLTKLESESAYTAQGIADLKLLRSGTGTGTTR